MSNYLEELFALGGKTAALSGAGGFLVSEMCRALARCGVSVAALDVRAEDAARTVDRIVQEGGKAIAIAMDVTRKEEWERALATTLEAFGQCDFLVNGAGRNAPTPFFDIQTADWQGIFEVQMLGTMLGCQVFGKYMVDRGKGSILNISSSSADPPLSKAFAYSASKAAIRNLTQNLAREWGTCGVRVNSLRPGFFPTEWNRKNFLSEERIQAIMKHTPMKRFGEPRELLGAVLWVLSDAANFVTGADICVDGGFAAMTI